MQQLITTIMIIVAALPDVHSGSGVGFQGSREVAGFREEA